MSLRPLNDWVVCEPLKSDETTPGGLLLPEGSRDSYRGLRALVVAVGPGAWTIQGTRLAPGCKQGDQVMLARPGVLIMEGSRNLCIVADRDVMAVIETGNGITRSSALVAKVALSE